MSGFEAAMVLTSIIGAGSSIYSATKGKPKTPKMPTPTAPVDTEAEAMAKSEAKRKRAIASRSASIFTSPLGVADQASVAKKVLLGR